MPDLKTDTAPNTPSPREPKRSLGLRLDAHGGLDMVPDVVLTCQRSGCTASSTTKLKQCVRCASAWYCSRECQRADWPVHRKNCMAASAAAAEPAEPPMRWMDKDGKDAPPLTDIRTQRAVRWVTLNTHILNLIVPASIAVVEPSTIACRVVVDDDGALHLFELLKEADVRRLYPTHAEAELKVLAERELDAKTMEPKPGSMRFGVYVTNRQHTTFAALRVAVLNAFLLGDGTMVPPQDFLDAFVTFSEEAAGVTPAQKIQLATERLCKTPGCDHRNHRPSARVFDMSTPLKTAASAKRRTTTSAFRGHRSAVAGRGHGKS